MLSKKNIVLFTLLFLLLLSTRLYKITSVPSVISHDEIYYPVQAKTIALAFTDPSGKWNPLSLTAAHPLYAELPGLVMSPASLLPNPLVAARFTHAVLGSFLVLILGALAFVYTKKKTVFFAVVLVGALNPWLFQFSRMGFDALFSLFFYFLGILLYSQKSNKWWLLSPVSFCLGFYQYQGLKIVFVPLVLTTVFFSLYQVIQQRKNTTQELVRAVTLLSISIILSLQFFYTLQNQAAHTRTGDLIFSDPTLATQVQVLRQQSIDSKALEFFSNKGTVLLQTFLTNYVSSLNPVQLFIVGEPLRNPFSVWTKGMFNPLDALLITVGAFVLLHQKKYRAFGIFLLVVLFIAPLPSALNAKGTWIMFRSSLYVPTLVILSGIGFAHLLDKTKLLGGILAFTYLLFAASFFYEYFYRYPVIGTSGTYFSERVVANYIKRNPTKTIIVLADETQFVYNSLLHFNSLITPQSLAEVRESYANDKYKIGNITIDNRCVSKQEIRSGTTVLAAASIPFCEEQEQSTTTITVPSSSIQSLLDSGEQFIVYNDTICTQYSLGTSMHVTKDVFALENLPDKEFCEWFFAETSNGKKVTATY